MSAVELGKKEGWREGVLSFIFTSHSLTLFLIGNKLIS